MHAEIAINLNVQPDEVVLDIGCADGNFLAMIMDRQKPKLAVGVELDSEVLEQGRLRRPQLSDTGLVSASAEQLGLADNSADIISALFVLYHTANPANALAEFHRVLKPDGTLVVATSGAHNKVRHRQFEQRIAQHLGIIPPPIFSEPFNADRAEELLQENFSIDRHVVQDTEMHITADTIGDYEASLNTMKDSFVPIPRGREWMKAVGAVVLPDITDSIERVGYFSDRIERHYYVCSPR
jgi:ubiquinone/menaquinone biosynthesis C-methylase UbiE